jgi:hypothetical protein
MKLKLDSNGNVVLQDGKPVYVHDDGKEIAFDAAAAVAAISARNAEAKTNRERAEAAEAKVKLFEGIDDPAAAKKALDTVKNLSNKQLVDAGEVEKVKNEAIKAIEEKYGPVVKENEALKHQLHSERIGGSFARSKVIAEKFTIPADMVESRFGKHFTLEDGKVVATDAAGNRIYSRSRPGELADFDEALETLVDHYPHKDHILKGSGATGSGTSQSNGGAGGKKTLTRSQFEALSPMEQAKAVKESTITD